MANEPTMLEVLRDLQDREFDLKMRKNFGEFRQDLSRGGLNAGLGMMGPYPYSSSSAPTGPKNRPFGNQGVAQQYGVPTGLPPRPIQPSAYLDNRIQQPPPYIDDVDMSSVWYSPMQPVWPFGPPFVNRPREWNYPVGYNLNFLNERMESVSALRSMRRGWGVLGTIIETRKDQLLRLPFAIQRKDKPRQSSKAVEDMRKFFRKPDGILTFGQWSRKLMDDLFVIDAPSIYIDRDLRGRPKMAEVIDGGTIFPLIDDAGRRPDTTYDISPDGKIVYEHRQPAFQQIVYGLPMVNLSKDELLYPMMRPRPDVPVFGYSPVEQILTETTEALRKTFYQLEFWRSGSMPELIVTVPDNWSPRQIAMFQGHFDALLSGQLSLKSKVRFVPGGMKPFDIKNASGQSLWSDRDELLVRLACFAFSIPPTAFVKQTNRGTASTAQQVAQEEGLYPLMSWWKDDIMDIIIQDIFGYDDIEFVFLPRPEVDQLKQAQIHQIQVNEGIRSRNEVREELGSEPEPDGDIITVQTGSGIFPLESVVQGEMLMPGSPGNVGNKPEAPRGKETPQNNNPMRGTPAPKEQTSAKEKLAEALLDILKVDYQDVKDAANDADGDYRDRSHAQLKTGNYRKGHIRIQGLDISIENKKGSKRGERDRSGKKWDVRMPAPYGYIKGTVGADGDQVDVYLGKKPESDIIWVVDQDKVNPEGKDQGFDEHKVMLGYKSLKKALKDYLKSHFENHGHERIRAVTELSVKDFKKWLKDGDMNQPISEQGVGEVVFRRGMDKRRRFQNEDTTPLFKADTISEATGLNWYDQGHKAKKRKKKKLKSGPQWLNLVA